MSVDFVIKVWQETMRIKLEQAKELSMLLRVPAEKIQGINYNFNMNEQEIKRVSSARKLKGVGFGAKRNKE